MRVYYIECKVNGIKEKFKFDNKKSLEEYLDSEKSIVLKCGNVTDVTCYSVKGK